MNMLLITIIINILVLLLILTSLGISRTFPSLIFFASSI